MAKKEVRVLSSQDLIDAEHGAIFVLNTTNKVGIPNGGDVFITVEVGKSTRTLKVPRTWIPIEVTKAIPRKNLTESASFLEAIGKGLITPIDTEDAKTIMRQSGYAEELRRLEEFEATVREASRAKGIGKNVTVSGGQEDDEEQNDREVKRKKVSVVSLAGDDGENESQATVSASFQAWVSKLNALDNEVEARNEIRTRGELEEEEAHYMLENIVYPKIKSRLAKALGRDA